jgi:hypothetical protein
MGYQVTSRPSVRRALLSVTVFTDHFESAYEPAVVSP